MTAFQTLEQALRSAAVRLEHLGSGRLDAELLLARLLGVPRGALLARGDDPWPESLSAAWEAQLAARTAGTPIAYLLGEHEFWSLRLRVTSAVLVPRPDTELLVERALLRAPAQHALCADIGTGSGAIALALAHERPDWQLWASDVSEAALEVARSNAATLRLTNVHFAQGNWCEPLGTLRFDLIASNPPYLAVDDPALADPVLQHEPRGALVSGPSGLEAYGALADQAPARLKPGGWLLLEHGAQQAAEVAARLVARGFTHVGCHRDLAGHARVTEGQWPDRRP